MKLRAIVVVALCLAGFARADEAVCESPEKLREALFEKPWPEIEKQRIADSSFKANINRLCYLTEEELLEYFTTGKDKLPQIESRVEVDSHTVGARTKL